MPHSIAHDSATARSPATVRTVPLFEETTKICPCAVSRAAIILLMVDVE
jgi:hypothetical protein